MTGVCGLVRKQNRDFQAESFETMLRLLARYRHGRIQKQHLKHGCDIAAVRYNASDLRNNATWGGDLGDWLFVGEARLDDRASVAAALGYDSDSCKITDEQLVCECLLKEDDALLSLCFGDWIVAGVHKRSADVLIAREPYGYKSLYYYDDPGTFAFSTAMDSLLSIREIRRDIDHLFVIRSMTRWPSSTFSTVFKGVSFLPPASILKLSERGIHVHRYWAMENCITPLKIDYQDAAQLLLQHLKQAVTSRIPANGQIGSMLSSGLDSSSVTSVAHEYLADTSRTLHCYSQSPLYRDQVQFSKYRIGDESDVAAEFAGRLSNTVFTKINSSDLTPVDGLRRTIMATCQPFYATSNDYWMHSLFSRAADDGNDVVLNGGMGNLTFSWGFLRRRPAWRLLREGKLREFYHQQRQLNPLALAAHRRLANRRTAMEPWTVYSIVNPQYARDIDMYSLMTDEGHDPTFYANTQASGLQERLDWINPGAGSGVLWDMAARVNGMDVTDPTADTRLILFTLCVPEHVFTGPNGESRWLAREAMRQYLPDSIRLRTVRGLQAADLNARLIADSQNMEALLEELSSHELAARMIDVDRMKVIWRAIMAENTMENYIAAWSLLLNGLSTGIFLTQYENF